MHDLIPDIKEFNVHRSEIQSLLFYGIRRERVPHYSKKLVEPSSIHDTCP
ncbi:MAG: hypothetical protein WCL23_02315 [Candidatus Moraniibacteriota bacterium]